MNGKITIKSVEEAHRLLGLEEPLHPLVSVVHEDDLNLSLVPPEIKIQIDLFQVWLKDGMNCEVGYGRNSYDFSKGTLAFMKPGQILTSQNVMGKKHDFEGWVLVFHPDLIRKSDLGSHIHEYGYFDYDVHEALHISAKEIGTLNDIVSKIETELSLNLDKYSQKLIVNNIELLLDYCSRFYDRQFITRTNLNQDLISKFNSELRNYFKQNKNQSIGIPSVTYLGEAMNMSAHYLSDLLKAETGKSALEHIHLFVLDRAKTMLLNSGESISQIAYQLGFEYPQYFTRLFKSKTGMSPSAYRTLN